jgi:hypothetical protein
MAHPRGEWDRMPFGWISTPLDRLLHDPAVRWIVGGKAAQRSAASPSQMGRSSRRNGSRPASANAAPDRLQTHTPPPGS